MHRSVRGRLLLGRLLLPQAMWVKQMKEIRMAATKKGLVKRFLLQIVIRMMLRNSRISVK